MSIQVSEEYYLISGYYHIAEEEFIINYLLQFGKSIIQIEPVQLKASLSKRAASLADYWHQL